MRNMIIQIMAAAIVLFAAPALFADGIFLKDGSIKEGAIDKKTEDAVTIITPDDLKLEIPMRKVLRIVAGTDYKKIYNLTEKSGETYKGYIVFEDPEYYLFRTKLISKKEKKFYKYDVSMIQDKGGSFRRERVTRGQMGYSPSRAAWISLVPMYSGSFIAGKKPLPGFVFAITKSAALLGPIIYPLIGTIVDGGQDYEKNNSIEDKYFKKRSYQLYAGISLGLWALLTAGDSLFSFNYIKNINKNYMASTGYYNRTSLLLLPRVSYNNDPLEDEKSSIEGVNFLIALKF